MTKIIENLMWRYATKKFDKTKKVSDEDLNELLESLRLSASSFGLQPWKFIVITDPKLRAELYKHSEQAQVTDASHLIVLCARTDIDEEYIKNYIRSVAETRKVLLDSLKGYEQMMLDFRKEHSTASWLEWTKNQVYLALGFLLSAAAQKRIDACPMEGFDSQKFDEVLKLKEKKLTSVLLCPVGYRSADDKHAKHAKVRFKKDEVVIVDST